MSDVRHLIKGTIRTGTTNGGRASAASRFGGDDGITLEATAGVFGNSSTGYECEDCCECTDDGAGGGTTEGG